MVERVWSARAASHDGATAYAAYFRRIVLPELAAVGGYRGAKLLQRDLPDGVEVVVSTRWDSLDAIHAFAGDDIARAVVHDEAAALFCRLRPDRPSFRHRQRGSVTRSTTIR